jgi:hypothetical protein
MEGGAGALEKGVGFVVGETGGGIVPNAALDAAPPAVGDLEIGG